MDAGQLDKPIDYTKQWYTELMVYLWQVEYAQKRTSPGNQLVTDCIAQAKILHSSRIQSGNSGLPKSLRPSVSLPVCWTT